MESYDHTELYYNTGFWIHHYINSNHQTFGQTPIDDSYFLILGFFFHNMFQ